MAINPEKLKTLSILSMDLERGELQRYVDETGGLQIPGFSFHGYLVNPQAELYLVPTRLNGKEPEESSTLEVSYRLPRQEDGKLFLEKINPSILSEETAEISENFIDRLIKRIYGAQEENRIEEIREQIVTPSAQIKVEEKAVPIPKTESVPTVIESAPEPTDREGRLRKIIGEIAPAGLQSQIDEIAYSLLHGGVKINISDRSDEAMYKRTLLGQLWNLRQMKQLERVKRKSKEPYDIYRAKDSLEES